MDTERARELLPWLLNDTLETAERDELLTALRDSGELRRELAETRLAGEVFAQHVAAADLVAHAFGEPAGLERARIEAHVALCEHCAEELALVHESRDLSAAEPATAREEWSRGRLLTFLRSLLRPFLRPAAAGPSTRWQAAALAASLVAVVGLGSGWIWSWQEAQGRQAALEGRIADLVVSRSATVPPAPGNPIDQLSPLPVGDVLRGGEEGAPGSLEAGPRHRTYTLFFYPDPLDPSTDVQKSFELRVIDPGREGGERELVRTFPAPLMPGEDHLVFRIPALPPGDYVGELYRIDPHRGWVLVESYSLPVRPAG